MKGEGTCNVRLSSKNGLPSVVISLDPHTNNTSCCSIKTPAGGDLYGPKVYETGKTDKPWTDVKTGKGLMARQRRQGRMDVPCIIIKRTVFYEMEMDRNGDIRNSSESLFILPEMCYDLVKRMK